MFSPFNILAGLKHSSMERLVWDILHGSSWLAGTVFKNHLMWSQLEDVLTLPHSEGRPFRVLCAVTGC